MKPAARAGCCRQNQIGAEQQVGSIGGRHRSAAASGAVAATGGRNIYRIAGIRTFVFQDSNVRVNRGAREGDSNDIDSGSGCDNVFGIVN